MKNIRETEFKKIIKLYIRELNAQYETFPLISKLLVCDAFSTNEKMEKFTQENNIDMSQNRILVPSGLVNEFEQYMNNIESVTITLTFLPRNYIVSLVGIFDTFISRLVKFMYHSKPEMTNAFGEKNLSYDKVLHFSNFEELKDSIIEEEAEDLLRESHINMIDYFLNKLGYKKNNKPQELFKRYSDFIEITERRNLYVHCNGIISKQYINVCKSVGLTIENKESTPLEIIGRDYITKAHNVLFEIGVELLQLLARKIGVEKKLVEESLQEITFDLLRKKNLELAINLLEFANSEHITPTTTVDAVVYKINLALAYYLHGEKDKCKEIVNKIDCTAYEPIYKMAKFILLEDFDSATPLMEAMDKNNFKMEYSYWPLFEEFRKTEQFVSKYKEIYNEEFSLSNDYIKDNHWERIIENSRKILNNDFMPSSLSNMHSDLPDEIKE